jgi:hypothetical protein
MLGHDDFSLEWVSVYRFQCRRLERFVHGRVVFVGDAAHQVSPFGARGANSGIQDADNLAWKLALVLNGAAPESLIETYEIERSAAADENIGHSTRSTDFIAPRSAQELRFRDAVLSLAREAPFAKRMVNSGRLSLPSTYDSPLSTPDRDTWGGTARLGAPLPTRHSSTGTGVRPGSSTPSGAMKSFCARKRTAPNCGRQAHRHRPRPHRPRGPLRRALRCQSRRGLSRPPRPAPRGAVAGSRHGIAHRGGAAHARHFLRSGPMAELDTEGRLPDPDAAYRSLIEAHRGLSDEDSAALNTRLVLLLANHIGDADVLAAAIAVAKKALGHRRSEAS